ncbi:MAG: extensin family protein, partial [Xanthobacteraceae bacterium]
CQVGRECQIHSTSGRCEQPYNASIPPEAARVKNLCILVVLLAALDAATAQSIPIPRARPYPGTTAEAPAAPPAKPAPSACRLRLKPMLAVAPSIDPIDGPGQCGHTDLVRLEMVILPDQSRVAISPPATLQCEMAEAIVHWVRDDLSLLTLGLGSPLRSIQNYASYHCRGRNNIAGAPISEHGKGNAIDIRSVRLADGRRVEPTDPRVSRAFRDGWRKTVCARFTTVLGPGSDGYHENHIHVDLMHRHSGYRMCQWDIRMPEEKPPEAEVVRSVVPLPLPRPKVDEALPRTKARKL